jgi:hypothetical protein
VRTLGLDGKEDFVKINAYDEKREKKLDVTQGEYDITVDTGPAFSTQREESFATLLDAAGTMPIIAELAPDLILKNLDVPGGDELVSRVRTRLIGQGVIQANEDEEKDLPPPPPPDPVQEALVANEMSKANLNEVKAAGEAADVDNTVADTAKKQAETDKLRAETIGGTIDSINSIEDNTR